MSDLTDEMRGKIRELERRIEKAIDALHHLANESVHRSHGCQYAEIDYEDMDDVIAILEGKDDAKQSSG